MKRRKLDKLHDREGWEAMVRYSTADLSDPIQCFEIVENLVAACASPSFWEEEGPLWPLAIREVANRYLANRQPFRPISDLELSTKMQELINAAVAGREWQAPPEQKKGSEALREAVQYCGRYWQSTIRDLLFWLAAPGEYPEAEGAAIELLNVQSRTHNRRVTSRSDADDVGGKHSIYVKDTYGTVASLVCEFLVDAINNDQILVRICARPGCGNLMLPKRTGRKLFCSTTCGTRAHQSQKSPEERRDYMWLYRLRQLRLPQLRRQLRQPNMVKRLAEMKRRWPQFAGMVADIEARAKGRSAK